jgi:hypothetical protein
VSELYRLRDRRLSTKLVSTFVDKWCHVVSVTDPYGLVLCFLDQIGKKGRTLKMAGMMDTVFIVETIFCYESHPSIVENIFRYIC